MEEMFLCFRVDLFKIYSKTIFSFDMFENTRGAFQRAEKPFRIDFETLLKRSMCVVSCAVKKRKSEPETEEGNMESPKQS
jgi:hypothetical protein